MKLVIIFDPNALFVNFHGEFTINPALIKWIDTLKQNNSKLAIHPYILTFTPGNPTIRIGHESSNFHFPLNEFFFDQLTDEALNQLQALFGQSVAFADICPNAPSGIHQFSDNATIKSDEIIVISANQHTTAFFQNKRVTIVSMRHFNQPITDLELNESINHSNTITYCDFDSSIFDESSIIFLIKTLRTKNLHYFLPKELIWKWHAELELLNHNQLLYLHTILLLLNLNNSLIRLITQRTYAVDSAQEPYNCAANTIQTINQKYKLNIQCHEQYFLGKLKNKNSSSSASKFNSKINFIYQSLQLKKDNKPTHIVFIDDDLHEIIEAENKKSQFEALSVKLIIVLVPHPIYFTEKNMAYFTKLKSTLSEKICEIYSTEMNKLNVAFNAIKNNFEKQSNKPVSSTLNPNQLFSGFYLNTPDTQNNTTRKTCVLL